MILWWLSWSLDAWSFISMPLFRWWLSMLSIDVVSLVRSHVIQRRHSSTMLAPSILYNLHEKCLQLNVQMVQDVSLTQQQIQWASVAKRQSSFWHPIDENRSEFNHIANVDRSRNHEIKKHMSRRRWTRWLELDLSLKVDCMSCVIQDEPIYMSGRCWKAGTHMRWNEDWRGWIWWHELEDWWCWISVQEFEVVGRRWLFRYCKKIVTRWDFLRLMRKVKNIN